MKADNVFKRIEEEEVLIETKIPWRNLKSRLLNNIVFGTVTTQ